MSVERRREERLPVIWTAKLVTEDGAETPCEVRDVSLAGTLITSDHPLPVGKDHILKIEGIGEFAAVVRWCGDGDMGLALLAGPDLTLKKFAEKAGAKVSEHPELAED